MADAPTKFMVPEYTILGSFGELYDPDGNFMSNVQEVTANIQIDRQDIMMSGTRRVGYKYTSVHGEGTMRGFRVTSRMARLIAAPMSDDRQPQWVGSLMVTLRDPEILHDSSGTPQIEQIQLQRCKWWGVNLGWAVNQIVEEDTPFTFQNIVWLSEIAGDPTATAPGNFTPTLPVIPKP